MDPQRYLDINFLVRHAKAVITDSGGITEETTVMGVPCMTLRNSTERPETVTIGTNELRGANPAAIGPALDRLHAGNRKRGAIPPLWDGRTSDRIVATLERVLAARHQARHVSFGPGRCWARGSVHQNWRWSAIRHLVSTLTPFRWTGVVAGLLALPLEGASSRTFRDTVRSCIYPPQANGIDR